MKDIVFYLTEHKGILKVVAILAVIFVLCSAGISTYVSSRPQENIKIEEKKKKSKPVKESKVSLTKKQKKTIQSYDEKTAQFEALLSANVWVTYSGSGRNIYFTDSSIIITDPSAEPQKTEKPFVIKALSTDTVNVGEMTNLTRYTCAYETTGEKSHVLTVDKNEDGSYFKMSIDLTGSGSPEEFSRTQAATTFEITGVSDEMSSTLKDSWNDIEDFIREQCALFYPNTVKAVSNNTIQTDFNDMVYILSFDLKDSNDDQITTITMAYNFDTHECSLK